MGMIQRALLALVVALAMPISAVHAGGYDTPMLYTAQHMGMGGTAVSSVDDPSALFHNPAGLAGTERLTVLGDFSLLLGNITGAPADGVNVESELTTAPFFLVGASGRITPWLTAGFAVYPVASAGATYRYNDGGAEIEDTTRLVFIEASPGVAFEVPDHNLSFGLSWRATLVQLDRSRLEVGQEPTTGDLDFSASGWSFAGVRAGVQWQPMEELQLGLAYRHKTTTDIEDTDSPYVLFSESERLSTSFTLPSRLSFGARGNFGDFSAALDLEYAFNSQNDRADLVVAELSTPVPNVFDWSNALTVRIGGEYRLLDGRLPLRLGFVWDQKTSSAIYPSAFGTPATATYIFTLGAGYQIGDVSFNVAYAHRRGSTTHTQAQFDSRSSNALGDCGFCGFAGDHSITLNGIYVDVAWSLGASEADEAAPVEN